MLCFHQNVTGCLTPIRVFLQVQNLKVDYGLAFLFKVHPCDKQKSNVSGMQETRPSCCHANTKSQEELESHAEKCKQLEVVIYVSQSCLLLMLSASKLAKLSCSGKPSICLHTAASNSIIQAGFIEPNCNYN